MEEFNFGCRKKERTKSFSQHHQSHYNTDTGRYQMNPFRCMATVGHNARVIALNRRLTEQEKMVQQRSEWDTERNALP